MIKMIQKNMNKKGFTLVELIIVIAVMAILAAIVIPRMTGITAIFRENADERSCETIGRELIIRIQTGNIADDADIDLTDVSGVITDGSITTPRTGGTFQYSYVAATDTLTVQVTGGTGTVTAFTSAAVGEID